MSIPVAIIALAATVGAFVPAPSRCVITRYKAARQYNANTARVTQRSRKPLSSLFSAEETEESADSPPIGEGSTAVSTDAAMALEEVAEAPPMTEQERAKIERLQEIERLRAKEKFVTALTGTYECDQCGFIYDPDRVQQGALPGTTFDDLPSTWRCPVCSAPKETFIAQQKTIAGFEDNMKYGLGGNTLTGGQKNALIFGGLAAFFALFLLGYALE